MDDLPPNLDRRDNGRCRAFFMAYEDCPGNQNPHEFALTNYKKYLDKALKLDQRFGKLPVCQPRDYDTPKLKPIRTRRRK